MKNQMNTTTAEKYKASLLPEGRKNVQWTIETYATYVNLLYPHITVPTDQEWKGAKSKHIHLCEKHGEYEVIPCHVLNPNQGCQCKGCMSEQNIASAGIRRQPRATQAEKDKAALLRAEGKSYKEIGRILGRQVSTICRWLNPEVAEKSRQYNAKWNSENREQQRASNRRYSSMYPHGKATCRKKVHKRRAIEYHCADTVFLPNHPDADHQGFVYYEMWTDYVNGDKEAQDLFSFAGADEAVATRKMQQDKLTKISGEKYSLEHLVPLSKGGIHHPLNFANRALQLNIEKGNKRLQQDDELFCKRLFDIK